MNSRCLGSASATQAFPFSAHMTNEEAAILPSVSVPQIGKGALQIKQRDIRLGDTLRQAMKYFMAPTTHYFSPLLLSETARQDRAAASRGGML